MMPMTPTTRSERKAILSWALYDWANSGFALIVMTAFFPLFLRQYWNVGGDPSDSTLQLGVANSVASIAVALLAPTLGTIADRRSAKRAFLVAFTVLAVVMTAALPLAARGNWPLAVALFVFASIGFHSANVFYDSLIVDIAPRGQLHRVSALGFGLGYLGGGVLFALNVAMTLWPAHFGLADSAEAVRLAFVLVAGWWALFSIPLLLFVREREGAGRGAPPPAGTLRDLLRLRPVWMFLLAYWCYIDGVHTIARMAVDYGMALGFDPKSLIVALLITQVVGFPAALAFGRLGTVFGARPALLAGIAVYAGVTLWSAFMTTVWEFYVLAAVIGLVQGGVQSLSRSCFAHLVPAGRSGAMFGFYNMTGRFAAVLGPLLVGLIAALTGNPRLSIGVILVLLVAGALLLTQVPIERQAPIPHGPSGDAAG